MPKRKPKPHRPRLHLALRIAGRVISNVREPAERFLPAAQAEIVDWSPGTDKHEVEAIAEGWFAMVKKPWQELFAAVVGWCLRNDRKIEGQKDTTATQ